jgi:hypothetical protein
VHQLCEGHARRAQDLLREQTRFSVNVLSTLVAYTHALVPPTIPDTAGQPARQAAVQQQLAHLVHALDAVTEAVQGPCPGNQALVCSLGLDMLRGVLVLDGGLGTVVAERSADWRARVEQMEGERALLQSAATLLLALLEGTHSLRRCRCALTASAGPGKAATVAMLVTKAVPTHVARIVSTYGALMLSCMRLPPRVTACALDADPLGVALLAEACTFYKLHAYFVMYGAGAPVDDAADGLLRAHTGRIEVVLYARSTPSVTSKLTGGAATTWWSRLCSSTTRCWSCSHPRTEVPSCSAPPPTHTQSNHSACLTAGQDVARDLAGREDGDVPRALRGRAGHAAAAA